MPKKHKIDDEKMTGNDFMPIIIGFIVGFIMYGLSVAMLPVITLTTINGFEVLLQPTVFLITAFSTVFVMLLITKPISQSNTNGIPE